MKLVCTPLTGVFIAESEQRVDARGSFTRLFDEKELQVALGTRHIVQINHSHTLRRGTIRGLHFQNPPFAETKFIRCLRGRVWDVAVDLRAGSPTFLRSHAIELDPENARTMVVPEGCAHGFQTLADGSELLYLHTAAYSPDAETGIAWNDPRLGIAWPLPLPGDDGLSNRDRRLPMIRADFGGVRT